MDDSESRPVLGSRELVNDDPPNVESLELQGPMTCRGPLALATAVLQINCGTLALVFCIISLQLPAVALEEFCANAGESAVSFQRASAPAVMMRKLKCTCCSDEEAQELPHHYSRCTSLMMQASSENLALTLLFVQVACAEFEGSNLQTSSISISVGNSCKRESKASFGCTCSSRNHEECDCAGTAYQAVADSWPIALILLGATGNRIRFALQAMCK